MNQLMALPARLMSGWVVWTSAASRADERSARPRRKYWAALSAGVVLVSLSVVKMTAALAFTTPVAGSFGFDVYDIVVNQILGGPIGFVGGVALIVWGGSQVIKNWVITILAIIAGTIIIRARTLVTSLGATI